jgi:hypothetical protein
MKVGKILSFGIETAHHDYGAFFGWIDVGTWFHGLVVDY